MANDAAGSCKSPRALRFLPLSKGDQGRICASPAKVLERLLLLEALSLLLQSYRFIIAFSAACCSPTTFLTEGCSLARPHQAASLGRPSVGALVPNCDRKLVIKNIVGASAASARVKAFPAAQGLPIMASS